MKNMTLRVWTLVLPAALFVTLIGSPSGTSAEAGARKKKLDVTFKADVFPIIEKRCLPCHAEDNFNPSELSLDSYDDLMKGGKHGAPVSPGDAEGSVLIKKVGPEPPFGSRMPLNEKAKIDEGKAKWLTDEEFKTITQWIAQGAKND